MHVVHGPLHSNHVAVNRMRDCAEATIVTKGECRAALYLSQVRLGGFTAILVISHEEFNAGLLWSAEESGLKEPYGLLSSSSHISESVPMKAAD